MKLKSLYSSGIELNNNQPNTYVLMRALGEFFAVEFEVCA